MSPIQITSGIQVIDSHTGGEPTRVVVSGGPELGAGTLAQRREAFRQRFDAFRSTVVNEPRGSDVLVGALLCPPTDPTCCAGVIFFNNVGYLGMCVHGTIGVVVTLAYLERIAPGAHRLETPVGVVTATLHQDGRVSVENVASFRHASRVSVAVDGLGAVTGDVAWGGNWFFLADDHGQSIDLANVERLTEVAWRIRQALTRQGITGAGRAEIDHIELSGPPQSPHADSKNFVLCPGKAYDRSPCGTGTSAKLACLIADGKLAPGAIWRQESIIGSIFEASGQVVPGGVIPTISGSAYITGTATLMMQSGDPYQTGIQP